jgi:hypothetical protein
VFGITTLDIQADDWRFPVTMVTVCVPFFVLIFVLQTRAGISALRKSGKYIDRHASRFFSPSDRRQLQQQHSSAGPGIEGSQHYPGPDGRRRRRRRELKRTQSGFSVNGGASDTERRARNWYRFPWRKRKAKQDSKEVIV